MRMAWKYSPPIRRSSALGRSPGATGGRGGVSGDRKAGIEELQVTAQRGHYLAPFARILLAIAYVRDKDKPRARDMLESLRGEFPGNPLFAHELARLESGP